MATTWDLLQGLSDDEVDEVLASGRERRFARREVVWHEGDRADTAHFVRSGRIAVSGGTREGDVGVLAVWGEGRVAGLIAVFASERYHTTSAFALEPTRSVAIRIDDLNDLRSRFPVLNDAIIRVLADKVLDLVGLAVDAMYVPADKRVVRRIGMLCEVYDEAPGEDTNHVVIPLTQEDVGTLAGVGRPTVNRVLQRKQQRGTLRISRGAITLLDKYHFLGLIR